MISSLGLNFSSTYGPNPAAGGGFCPNAATSAPTAFTFTISPGSSARAKPNVAHGCLSVNFTVRGSTTSRLAISAR